MKLVLLLVLAFGTPSDLIRSLDWPGLWRSPFEWQVKIQQIDPHPWQTEIDEQITKQLREGKTEIVVVMKKAHGTGGTFQAASLAHWWMCTRPGSRGLTTAPSWAGVRNLFWPEFWSIHRGSLIGHVELGKGHETELRLDKAGKWKILGQSTNDYWKMEGHHSTVAVVRVIDEAKAVPPAAYEATMGMFSSEQSLDILSSTPGFEYGDFFKAWKDPDPNIIKMNISGPRAIREGLPGMEVNERKLRRRYGVNSEIYRARWEAIFMRSGQGSLIHLSSIEAAQKRPPAKEGFRHAAMDLARSETGDLSVLGLFIDDDLVGVMWWQEGDSRNVVLPASVLIANWGAQRVRFDAPGVGGGIIDQFKTTLGRLGIDEDQIEEYWPGNPANDPETYKNRTSEAVNLLAKKFLDGVISIPLTDLEGREIPLEGELQQYHHVPGDDSHRLWVKKRRPKTDKFPGDQKSPDFGDVVVIGTAPVVVREVDEYLDGMRELNAPKTGGDEQNAG